MERAGRHLAYRPGLDGVRTLAVIAVLAFHDGRLRGGFLGVSTFFTLSGFLITGLVLSEFSATRRISLRTFYARRARRLLPAAFLGIALAAIVVAATADARAAHNFRFDGLAALADVANWRFLLSGHSYVDLFTSPSPVQHYWSLAIEEQFYLVLVPLTVAVLWLARGRRALLGVVFAVLATLSFADGWLAVRHGVDRAYYGTDTRALEFLVGALLAVALLNRRLGRRASRVAAAAGVVALVGLAAATFVARTSDAGLFRGGLLVFAVGSAALVLAASEPGPVRWLCSLPPLRALGLISYGVYVFHWPVFLWLTAARAGFGGIALTGVRVAVTLAIATASFVLIERPIREGRRVVGRTRWTLAPAAALACGTAAVVVGLGPVAGAPVVHFAPALSSSAMANLAPALTPAAAPEHVRATARRPAPPPPRVERVLLVGDSVALTLGRGIERWGLQHGVAVLNDGKLGCSLLNGAFVRGYWGVEWRPPDACHTDAEWASIMARFHPDLVVALFGAWDVYDASWDGGHTWHPPGDAIWNAHYTALVADAVNRLRATGAHELWLDPPCFTAVPGRGDPSAPWYDPARVDAVSAVFGRVAQAEHVAVTGVVHAAGCPVDLSTRPDGVHYSDPGADRVAARLAPILERALAS